MQLGMIGLGRMGGEYGAPALEGRPSMRRVQQVGRTQWRSW